MKLSSQKIFTAFIIFVSFCFIISCGGSDTPEETLQKAQKAFSSGNYLTAVEHYRKLYQQRPTDPEILYELGMSYKKANIIDSALSFFRRANILKPGSRDISQQLLELCPEVKNWSCAIEAINTLIATGDNEIMYLPKLAEYSYRAGYLNQAALYLERLMKHDPEMREPYLQLSTIYSQQGHYEKSVELLEEYLEKFGPSAEIYANLALNYISLENYEKAEGAFRNSLKVNPDNVPIWINLAHLLSDLDSREKKKEALEIYKRFYKQTPPVFKLDSIIPALEKELSAG